MIISERWLRDWVEFDAPFDSLPDLLTGAGLEAGSVEKLSRLPKGIVAAQVISVERHPDADGLSVCRVDAGGASSRQVVCGAPNVFAGMMAPFAKPGTKIPSGVEIKKQEIRGVRSDGMLCSASELGLEDQSDGVLELDPGLAPGADLNEQLQLPDRLFEVELTPNRGDCLSILGVARETAAVTGGVVKLPRFRKTRSEHKTTRKVVLDAPQGCPRYAGRCITSVRPASRSSDLIRERLRRSGLRSIDALVDITNYVMLELGQPMHAFDEERLQGEIAVRMANSGEKLTLLDGQKIRLDNESLVISDRSGAIALAGVKGGASTMIGASTTALFLEAAHFTPTIVARTARKFTMNTDASHRFERGVDFKLPVIAIERASQLVVELCGGALGPITCEDAPELLPKRQTIYLRRSRLKRMLGTAVPAKKVDAVFASVGFRFKKDTSGWRATPPSHRFDLGAEHDLVEEVARLVGYDAFASQRPRVQAGRLLAPEGLVQPDRARDLLVDLGYHEAITYSFISETLQQQASGGKSGIRVKNPIAAQLAEMRLSLVPGLLEAVANNARRQVRDVRLFEVGHVFLGSAHKPREEQRLAAVAAGTAAGTRWDQGGRPIDFFDIKGHLEQVLRLSGRTHGVSFESAIHPSYQTGQCARVTFARKEIGWLGRIHHQLLQAVDLDRAVYAFEINWEAVCQSEIPIHKTTSRFPFVTRDLSMVFADKVQATEVENCIKNAAGVLLSSIEIIDLYKEKNTQSTEKSLTFRLTLQADYRNLTDEEADEIVRVVVQRVGATIGGQLRSN